MRHSVGMQDGLVPGGALGARPAPRRCVGPRSPSFSHPTPAGPACLRLLCSGLSPRLSPWGGAAPAGCTESPRGHANITAGSPGASSQLSGSPDPQAGLNAARDLSGARPHVVWLPSNTEGRVLVKVSQGAGGLPGKTHSPVTRKTAQWKPLLEVNFQSKVIFRTWSLKKSLSLVF